MGVWLWSQGATAALLQIHEDQLLSSCQSLKQNSAALEAASCATYINGFLDGALLTDSDNASELQEVARDDFISRALRTRLGGRAGDGGFLHFCVPAERARADIIEQLVPHLPEEAGGVDQLRASVYRGLKAEFPCPSR